MTFPADYENKVLCADCLEVMKDIPDNSIDLVLTDPPYGINYWSNRSDAHELIQNDKLSDWFDILPEMFKQFKRILTPLGCCCCCCGGGGKTPVTAIMTLELIKHLHLIQTLVWDKQTIGLGWRYRPSYENILIASKDKDNYNFYDNSKKCSNIIRCGNVIPQANDHPTVKPIKLMKKLILIHSNPGDLICDPFAGSGTTLVAAKDLGRRFIGIDIKQDYVDICNKRLNAVHPKLEGIIWKSKLILSYVEELVYGAVL